MNAIAKDVLQLPLAPRSAINAYLLGDVLVDAGVKPSAGRLLKALRGHAVAAHAATHAHPDHLGASRRVLDAFGLDGLWIGERDAPAASAGRAETAPHAPLPKLFGALGGMEPVPVTRSLREGDEVGPGFVVLDAPGHSAGHVAFWRESDRVLILGDVFFGMSILTTAPGIREPPRMLTYDPATNRASQRRLAALRPSVVGFGHGPVVRDPDALARFVATLES